MPSAVLSNLGTEVSVHTVRSATVGSRLCPHDRRTAGERSTWCCGWQGTNPRWGSSGSWEGRKLGVRYREARCAGSCAVTGLARSRRSGPGRQVSRRIRCCVRCGPARRRSRPPPRAPTASAYAKRWVRTVSSRVLGRDADLEPAAPRTCRQSVRRARERRPVTPRHQPEGPGSTSAASVTPLPPRGTSRARRRPRRPHQQISPRSSLTFPGLRDCRC
jgi:hypothetical protein